MKMPEHPKEKIKPKQNKTKNYHLGPSGAYGKEQSNSVSLDSGMKSKQKQHRQSPVDLDSLGFSWIGLQNDQEFFGRRARHKEIE